MTLSPLLHRKLVTILWSTWCRSPRSGNVHAPHSQVESGLAVQQLKPTIDLIKRRYGDDKARIQKETAALYEKTGVNPLAGERSRSQCS